MKRILVGRGNDCDIVIPDERDNVSRHHMVITFNILGKMTISDTSSNGTFINGKRMLKGTSIPVTANDQVRLGDNWIFDWKQVTDPYKDTRRNVIFILSLLIIAIGGITIWQVYGNTDHDDNAATMTVPKSDIKDSKDTWNKDSTKKVAPTEMSISVSNKTTSEGTSVQRKKQANRKANNSIKNTQHDKSRKSMNKPENSSENMPIVN